MCSVSKRQRLVLMILEPHWGHRMNHKPKREREREGEREDKICIQDMYKQE